MGIFGKIFKRGKIKYVVKVYDGNQWIEVADGVASGKEGVEEDVNSIKESGVLTDKMTYRVEDSKGNVLFMNMPSKSSRQSGSDKVVYRIEYRQGKGTRWQTYDESDEEYDIDMVDEIVDSGKLPPGSEVRIVMAEGRKKQVIYRKDVEGSSPNNGLVAETGSNIVINVEGIRQIKRSIDALREVRDTLNDVLGDNKPQSVNVSPNDYEGKPPWFMRPDVIQPFMQMAMGMMGRNFVGGGSNQSQQSSNYSDDKLEEYID